MGKVVGGGLPVGAYGGREDLMRQIAPDGPVYQAGTLSGNPLPPPRVSRRCDSCSSIPTCTITPSSWAGKWIVDGARCVTRDCHLPGTESDRWDPYFSRANSDRLEHRFRRRPRGVHAIFLGMLDRGIYLAPSPFEVLFLSTAHTEADIERTLDAAREVLIRVFDR